MVQYLPDLRALGDEGNQTHLAPQFGHSSGKISQIADAMGLRGPVSGKIEAKDFHGLASLLKARHLEKKSLQKIRGWVFKDSGRKDFTSRAHVSGVLPTGKGIPDTAPKPGKRTPNKG